MIGLAVVVVYSFFACSLSIVLLPPLLSAVATGLVTGMLAVVDSGLGVVVLATPIVVSNTVHSQASRV